MMGRRTRAFVWPHTIFEEGEKVKDCELLNEITNIEREEEVLV